MKKIILLSILSLFFVIGGVSVAQAHCGKCGENGHAGEMKPCEKCAEAGVPCQCKDGMKKPCEGMVGEHKHAGKMPCENCPKSERRQNFNSGNSSNTKPQYND